MWQLARALEMVVMPIEMTECEDCGITILIWSKQDRVCYNCKQIRILQDIEQKKDMEKTAKATGTYRGGLDRWI